jgi:putative redox protein
MVRIKRIPQTGLRIQAVMESPQRVIVRTNEKSVRLDMPELLGGTNRGLMPLEALLASYAGSLNVVGNFVAKTMDFALHGLDFTIWAEFDPRGIYGLAKVAKPILVVHVEARVTTPEPERRLTQLRKTLAERDPVHNLLKSAGVRFKEKWECVPPSSDGSAKKARSK